MANILSGMLAVFAAAIFWMGMEYALVERQVEVVFSPPTNVKGIWDCNGWTEPMYPTEKSMRRAFE